MSGGGMYIKLCKRYFVEVDTYFAPASTTGDTRSILHANLTVVALVSRLNHINNTPRSMLSLLPHTLNPS